MNFSNITELIDNLQDDSQETDLFSVERFHSMWQFGIEIDTVAFFQYQFFVVDL